MPRLFARGTDKIDLSNSALLMPTSAPAISFAGWAKFTDFSSENWLYARYLGGSNGSTHLIRCGTDGKLNIFWVGSDGNGHGPTGTSTLTTALWYHLGGVIFDNGSNITATIYLNGVSDGFEQVAVGWTTNTIKSMLGAAQNGSTMAGAMAHWGYWRRNLVAKEMVSLAAGMLPSQLGADHYWPLFGNDSPEPDLGAAAHLPGTVTGTTLVSGGRAKLRPLALAA